MLKGTHPTLGPEWQLSEVTSGLLCCCRVEGARGGGADRRASREDLPGAGAGLMLLAVPQALQAPACHENLVKVGGYILGEFGNLIAGDPRSR